ncbi:hypothetical protein HD806DRAFT_539897 [Xylariaceae sp. AK1471]|nr:hypothetical protein HD806DRAFT_539897 [Xylariaceae sp. AK1471]
MAPSLEEKTAHLEAVRAAPIKAEEFAWPRDPSIPSVWIGGAFDAISFACNVVRAPLALTGPQLVYFTDGSTRGQHSGAAGILGVNNDQAELLAINLAMKAAVRTAKSLREEKWANDDHRTAPWMSIHINSDSKRALCAIGEYIDYNEAETCGFNLTTFYDLMSPLNELHELKVCVELRWGPGHIGLDGNERADQEARGVRQLMEVLQPTRQPLLQYQMFSKRAIRDAILKLREGRKRKLVTANETAEEKPPIKKTRNRTGLHKRAKHEGEKGGTRITYASPHLSFKLANNAPRPVGGQLWDLYHFTATTPKPFYDYPYLLNLLNIKSCTTT